MRKMESEGPYKIMLNDGRITAVSGPNGCWGTLEGDDLAMVLNDAHAEGRKAERERCAKIAEVEAGEIPECVTGRIIATKIRGGQDEK